jgi:hypothetical protein
MSESVCVLRPKLAHVVTNYARGVKAGGVTVATGTLLVAFMVISHQVPAWVVLVPVGLALVGALLGGGYVSQIRLRVSSDSMWIYRGILRRSAEIRCRDLGAIRLREVHQTAVLPASGGGVPTYKVLFVDHSGHLLQRISGWGWSVADLQRVGHIMAVPVDPVWLPAVAGTLRDTVPGSVGWFEALSTWRKPLLLLGLALAGLVIARIVVR